MEVNGYTYAVVVLLIRKKKRVPDTHLVGLRGGMNFSEKR
jgi:hypothetical protein